MHTNLDGALSYNRRLALTMRLQAIRDPYDSTYPMLVDLDDMIIIQQTTNWCSGCKANVPWVDGKWTYWLGELDKWYCEAHK